MRTLFLHLDRLCSDCGGSLQYTSLALLIAIAAILAQADGHFLN
jgi:hypothetical protein